tara:strand:+ start:607 stop:993 length:387 start_codon:yes stop_codon:yes gene_type:complete
MAIGLSPSLPLGIDPRNGYSLHQDMVPMVLQNFKMVVLTSPGERAMNPHFGVGLKHYLFEPDTPVTHADIKSIIIAQANEYLPYIKIEKIEFKSQGAGNSQLTPNYTNVKIKFRIVPLQTDEVLDLNL